MIANHTSMATMMRRICVTYERLRKRNAFLDNYRKYVWARVGPPSPTLGLAPNVAPDASLMALRYPLFADGLEEFDSAREIVGSLIDEYRACEGDNYPDWEPASTS